jgi:uncharacterized protein (TIGR00299 family) protein
LSKIIYFDCPTGISGDMILAALIGCGADLNYIRKQLARLTLPDWQMEYLEVQKNGITAGQVAISYQESPSHCHLPQIEQIIRAAKLPDRAETLALTTFRLLAQAEAAAHGCPREKVHFHEVGATDAILDICGAALALDALNIDAVYASPLPLSHGFVDCTHGRLAVPTPAVLQLLQGADLVHSPLEGELITPTGAAILHASLAVGGFRPPQFSLQKVGLGAGQKDLPMPNIMRALLGQVQEQDCVDVITCWLDDCQGEFLGHLWQKITVAEGFLDMAYNPVFMKKGRPGWQLTVIARAGQGPQLAQLIMHETTTIGLRIRRELRLIQPRQNLQVDTDYGKINIKVSGKGQKQNIAPEYESCIQAAATFDLPLKTVYQAAIAAFLQENHKKES